jgi:hypothetical protein
LKFFFPNDAPLLPAALTPDDCCFAQALLVEAIDKSYAMGYVEAVYNAFFMKIPDSFSSIQDMVKDFAKEAVEDWFKHATSNDLKDPKIYENVRVSMSLLYRSTWESKDENGKLTW